MTLVVNGVAIAQGELIKVGERLAVEIQRSHL
ncbi:FliM/FliN family flagellar motor switch protein [Proteus vulgaris]